MICDFQQCGILTSAHMRRLIRDFAGLTYHIVVKSHVEAHIANDMDADQTAPLGFIVLASLVELLCALE